jgi:hypothetical protein
MESNKMNFRPIDNSSKTILSYDLEAAHWIRALNSAQNSTANTISFFELFGIIGNIINIFVILVSILIMLLIKAYGYLFSDKKITSDDDFNEHQYPHTPKYLEKPTEDFYRKWD